jgi:hypothetical protein
VVRGGSSSNGAGKLCDSKVRTPHIKGTPSRCHICPVHQHQHSKLRAAQPRHRAPPLSANPLLLQAKIISLCYWGLSQELSGGQSWWVGVLNTLQSPTCRLLGDLACIGVAAASPRWQRAAVGQQETDGADPPLLLLLPPVPPSSWPSQQAAASQDPWLLS